MHQKETYFLIISSEERQGIGECALFRGLSCDDRPDYEEKLQWLCEHIEEDKRFLLNELLEFPSIQFGLEQALLSLESDHGFDLFPSKFVKGKDGISINGLIWMGDEGFMRQQISQKLSEGFTTLKMKIGAIDFNKELNILSSIRENFNSSELELRVDANGAFGENDVREKLDQLSKLEIHSIEQPIKARQLQLMTELCLNSPLPIALDEELIGIFDVEEKLRILTNIKPQYIILKPSLVGGIAGTNEWIKLAESFGIGWWITSALESNIGLNAIAQYCYTLNNIMPQGLGTGGLFSNNISSPLFVKGGALFHGANNKWGSIHNFLND